MTLETQNAKCRGCNSPAHGFNKLCDFHCTGLGHGHCIYYYGCGLPSLKGSNYCGNHCELCKNPIHKGSNKCKSHCTEGGHGHCLYSVCDSQPHEGSHQCITHCYRGGMGIVENCVILPLMKEVIVVFYIVM